MTKRIKVGEEISFQWSDYDRLLRVESDLTGRKQDNRYDFNGIRKRKLDKNGNSSREYTASISTSTSRADLGSTFVPTISYLSIGGAIVGYEEDDGTTSEFRFFLTDALSTVRDIVDDAGAVVRSYEFDEYGNELSSSGSATNSAKTWVGGFSVNDDRADSGLFLMGHRHFSSDLGIFLSRDPIGFESGDLNLYRYAGGNPTTFTDPTGLDVNLELVVVEGGTYNQLGHSFIEVTPIKGTGSQWQARSSYATYPPKPNKSSVVPDTDLTFGYGEGTRRKRLKIRLNNKEERRLIKYIKDAKKNVKWSPINNCGDFAIDTWNFVAPSDRDINPADAMESIDPTMVNDDRVKTAINMQKILTGSYPKAITPRRLGNLIDTLNR